jgi:hypothetical protein
MKTELQHTQNEEPVKLQDDDVRLVRNLLFNFIHSPADRQGDEHPDTVQAVRLFLRLRGHPRDLPKRYQEREIA